MAFKEKPDVTVIENCACAKCDAAAREASAIGSYSCLTNVEKQEHEQKRWLSYPTLMAVMRHSERMDDMFPGWDRRFEPAEAYAPYDLNMPQKLPIHRPIDNYRRDPMLTRTGCILAQIVGQGLYYRDKSPDVIYCSPALRCLQTAEFVRQASGSSASLRVEPGLFENMSLYDAKPKLLSPEHRTCFGVDRDYKPLFDFDQMYEKGETNKDYNERIHTVLHRIATTAETCDGPRRDESRVLVVGHASTVDMAVGLLGEPVRHSTMQDLHKIGDRVPYCSLVCLVPQKPTLAPTADSVWKLQIGAVPPVSYKNFSNRPNHLFIMRK
ncbi:unnamed protein product, partial [Mesorhabditis spiculigera]